MAEQKNTLQASHNKKVFAIETGGFISHCGILAVLAVRIWRQLTRQPPPPPPPPPSASLLCCPGHKFFQLLLLSLSHWWLQRAGLGLSGLLL